jgi:mannosyl-glycoprotein endo-beta-N-acetylglucosaminidase
MSSSSSVLDVCHPFVNLDELLSQSQRHEKLKWCDLVISLVKRSVPRFPTRSFYSMSESVANAVPDEDSLRSRPQVLVCHDYKGNYLDDRFLGIGTRKWEEYRFYNWNVVDIFCYFSHNLITIPTLQYLNAAHLNGVKVIGTFIVEGSDGHRNLREILKSREQCERVADSLVEISKRLKFEGYLLNVEVPVNSEKIPMLKHFVHYLTQKTHDQIPDGMILWYDSVVSTGGLIWQNELNEKNE